MKNIKKTIFYSSALFFAFNCHLGYAAQMTPQPELTLASLQEAFAPVLAPLAYVGLTVELYHVAKGAKSLLLPTVQEQDHATEVDRKMKSLDAKKEFRSCLMKNRTASERGPSGLPSACGQVAYMLEMLGEEKEVEKITATFNHYRK